MIQKKLLITSILILVFLLKGLYCCAQESVYDSLMNSARKHIFKTPDETIFSLKKALEIAKELNDLEKITSSTIGLGVAYSYATKRQNEAILTLLADFLNQYENKVPEYELAKIYNIIGATLHDMGDGVLSIDHYFIALGYAEQGNNSPLTGKLYHNIGVFYNDNGDYKKAAENYYASQKIAIANKDSISISYCYYALGNLYLNINKLDSTDIFFHRGLLISRELEYSVGIVNSLIGLGDLALKREQHELAKGYYNKALEEKVITETQRILANNQLGIASKTMKDYENAIQYFNIALNLAKEESNFSLQASCLKELYEIHELIKSPEKALSYLKVFEQIKDSIHSISIINRIKTNEYHFESKYRKVINQKSNDIINLIVTFSILSFLFISYFIFIQFKKKTQIIKRKQLTINLQKEDEINLIKDIERKRIELAQKVLQLGSETSLRERLLKRIAIIDSSNLNSTKLHLKAIQSDLKNSSSKNFWEEFEMYFTQVHPTFYKGLNHFFPKLTPNERKLCGFIKLNLSNKDISKVTSQNPNSIKVARGRLRKKLGITGEKTSLIEFLNKY